MDEFVTNTDKNMVNSSGLEMFENFINQLRISADLAIPYTKTTSHRHHPKVPWWNQRCAITTQAARNAFYKFRKTPSTERKIEYKKRRAQARRTIKESKAEAWKVFLKTLNPHSPTKYIWNAIQRIQGAKSPHFTTVMLDDQNETIQDIPDIADLLGEAFIKNSTDNNYLEEFIKYKNTTEKEYPIPSNLNAKEPNESSQ